LETQSRTSDTADFCRALFESLGDGCFHCQLIGEGEEVADWRFLAANPAFESLTGLRNPVGRRASEAMPGIRESSPELFALFRRVAATGRAETLDMFLKGLERWMSVEAMSPCPGQVTARMKVINVQKTLEDTLRQHEAFIRSILDNLPVGIAVNDPDSVRQPTYMNDLFPKLYRTTREALGGSTADLDTFWEKVYEDPALRSSIRARVLADIGSGDPSRMHWERVPITRKGEGTTYVDAMNLLVPGTSMMISTVWDVTEKVRKDEETRRLEAHLHQVQQMESLGLLAGGIAHDINNVLGSILAVATIHRRKAEDGSPLRRDMETIAQACIRGGSLTKSLQGFARKELGEERLLDLNDLIRGEVRLLEHSCGPTLHIQEDLSADLHGLRGDPEALGHLVMSLCANAIEAMPEGGTLWIRTRNDGPGAVLLEVEDSGIGMTSEVLHQSMVPFYTTKQSNTGTGLGLSIVYGTVQSHRGTIDLHSEPGRGTLVRLRFPAASIDGMAVPERKVAAGQDPTTGKHILLVDDDPLILQSLPGLLECLGHSARAVESSEQALALIGQGFKPDLVILDLHMPGMGGLETLVQLREQTPALPILLSTGLWSKPIREVVRDHPGVQLIVKPFTKEDLERRIQTALPSPPDPFPA
jgi:signal transduction histidine kinase